MNHKHALLLAEKAIQNLNNHEFDILNISRPSNVEYAISLGKFISKLSPMMSNLIEFKVVENLNRIQELQLFGKWKRQDPGFPDAIFQGDITPVPGIEIKTWFPLATEITARFRETQFHFQNDETKLLLISWIPQYIIWGKPKVLDICLVSALTVAKKRDNHYFNPPYYLVVEPEDTSLRTSNLQQTNVNGYRLQENNPKRIREAELFIQQLGSFAKTYNPAPDFQQKVIRPLLSQYNYRLDTNFAKIDRIQMTEIELFKKATLDNKYFGKSIHEWSKLLSRLSREDAQRILELDKE